MFPPLLFASMYSTWGLAAALAAVCFLALRGNWFRQKRSEEATPDPKTIQQSYATNTRAATAHHAPEDLLRWQVELHEMARDVKAEIDTKLLALQSLMVLANEHSARLESLLSRAEQNGGAPKKEFVGGREILDRIENGVWSLPALDARAQGREILTPAQAKLAQQLRSEEEYTPAQIANYIGAAAVDVELYLSLSPTAPATTDAIRA